MNAPFKFVIKDKAGLYYSVSGGTVNAAPPLVYLPPTIVDWATLSLNFKRDMALLGVIRGYSPEMVRFVKQAAKILRYIKYHNGGTEAVAYLGVYIYNKSTLQYDLNGYWQFDFSKTKNKINYYDIAIMEGGLSSLLKSNMTSNYSVPLNDPQILGRFPAYNPVLPDLLPLTPRPPAGATPDPPRPQLIFCDGIPILGSFQYTVGANPQNITLSDGPDVGTVAPTVTTAALSATNNIGDYGGSVGRTNTNLIGSHSGIDPILNTVSFLCEGDATIKIAYNLQLSYILGAVPGSHGALRLRCAIFDGAGSFVWGTQVGAYILWEDADRVTDSMGFADSGNLRIIGESVPIPVQKYYTVVIGFSFRCTSTLGPPTVAMTINPAALTAIQSSIAINYQFLPASSVVRAITQAQLFDYLTAMVATSGGTVANPYASRSNLLTTGRDAALPQNADLDTVRTFVTSGDALRGLKTITVVDPYYPVGDPDFPPGSPIDVFVVPAIYTNMSDFAKDLLSNLCAGIGIERDTSGVETLVAEELYYFFDDSVVIADLGTNIGDDFEMNDFNDYRGSNFSIGQQDQQFDAINGPLETMSKVDYSTPVTRTIKNIDLATSYREDPYGIELTRANIGNKTNINSSSDNDTFKLHVRDLTLEHVEVLDYWGGLSGYSGIAGFDALRLERTADILSGMPSALLTPEVDPYSMFNMAFSPRRKAQRLLPWLCSNYRGLVDSLCAVTGYKKNIKMQSRVTAGSSIVNESDFINVSEIAQTYTPPFLVTPVTVPPAPIPTGRTTNIIWKPFTFSFTGPAIKGLPLLMTPPGTPGGGKMYGKIKFTLVRGSKRYPLSGFVLDVGITPGSNKAYNYMLLASPTCVIPDDL